MMYLALTFGLEHDSSDAVGRMAGIVERTGYERGVEFPLQMTIAVTDGERLWVFRYSSQGASRSLYYSTQVEALRALHPGKSSCRRSATRLASSCPSRWAICPASGTRSPRAATASCGPRRQRPPPSPLKLPSALRTLYAAPGPAEP